MNYNILVIYSSSCDIECQMIDMNECFHLALSYKDVNVKCKTLNVRNLDVNVKVKSTYKMVNLRVKYEIY